MNMFAKLFLATGCTALTVTPALAERAESLTYLNGQNAGSVTNTLEQRGFIYIDTNRTSSGYSHSYFWHSRDKNCVDVEVYGGNVMTINDAQPGDCNQQGSDGAATAIAVGLGAALIGGLIASRSHHRGEQDQNHNQQQRAEFDRGYTDGLHNASYHNYNNADEYSRGYEAGVDEREANLRHHQRRGGYQEAAQWQDLIGSRAAGGMEELERRGFTQVDNFASGTARYSIQWRAASRQCLQVIVADGRLENITDIQTHSNCR